MLATPMRAMSCPSTDLSQLGQITNEIAKVGLAQRIREAHRHQRTYGPSLADLRSGDYNYYNYPQYYIANTAESTVAAPNGADARKTNGAAASTESASGNTARMRKVAMNGEVIETGAVAVEVEAEQPADPAAKV